MATEAQKHRMGFVFFPCFCASVAKKIFPKGIKIILQSILINEFFVVDKIRVI
jgi:hypothetical protein